MEMECDGAFIPDEDREESPFEQLPEEMFLYICSFLDATDIVCSLSKVCKKFYYILQSNDVWRCWVAARWGGHYPILDVDTDLIPWKEVCFSLENEFKKWSCHFKQESPIDVHFSDVDAVLFLNSNTCITGSRDRNIVVWDVDDGSVRARHELCAHDGWVWRMKMCGDLVYSCSWDTTIKTWECGTRLTPNQSYKCDTPVLSLDVETNGVFYGGCFKNIFVFDSRVGITPIYSLPCPKPVLTINKVKDQLVSGCENKIMTMWDLSMRQPKQVVTLPGLTYATSSHVFDDVLYTGNRDGKVRLCRMIDGMLEVSDGVEVGHQKQIQTIKVCRGSIVTASNEEVIATLPLKPTRRITHLPIPYAVSGMDYLNDRLACGSLGKVLFYFMERDNE